MSVEYVDVDAPYRYVYYAKKGDLIKIGISHDPWYRAFCQQAELLGVEPRRSSIREGFKHEKVAHARWAHLGVRSEWFKPAPDLMAHIATLECPPETYQRRKRAS